MYKLKRIKLAPLRVRVSFSLFSVVAFLCVIMLNLNPTWVREQTNVLISTDVQTAQAQPSSSSPSSDLCANGNYKPPNILSFDSGSAEENSSV
ncbi:MAG: hypothetical protein NVSMB56_02730 [Pyrinomonadaceae bacterium]